MARSSRSAAARAWSTFGKLACAKSGFPPPLPRNSGATDWRISAASTGTSGPRETMRRTSFGALAHRIAVARVSEAIALDIDIINPTPSATSCFTRGQAILVVWTASRAFAHTQLPGRDGAALIQSETELPLREIARQDLGADLSRRQDLIVRQLLNLRELRIRQGVEVRDVESGHVGRFVRARLPDVVSEDLARRAEHDVGR